MFLLNLLLMNIELPPPGPIDACGFRAEADKFITSNPVGEEFRPHMLKRMERYAGNTARIGESPDETRRVQCGSCTGCLVMRIERDEISEVVWTGDACKVQADAIERARLATEEAASGKKKKLL